MKTALLNFIFLIVVCSTLNGQPSIAGTWMVPLDPNEGYDSETLILTQDGYFCSILAFLNGAEYGIDPEASYGIYEFDGRTLSIYDMKNDTRKSLPVKALSRNGLVLHSNEVNQDFKYSYQGEGILDQNQRVALLSWENYRKLGGTWKSSESILKVLPSLGIIIIRAPGNPDFFKWGHYLVDGNGLTLKEISAEEAVFYNGTITAFNRQGFTIVNNGEEEFFKFQGGLNLDATETMMVQQYMNMNHRISMTAIDMIDGVQDFIWKRVDEYGNERY